MTVHNTPSPIDAKIQTKKPRQMAKMSRKISHSTVCMLAFSAVALATMPSGRHPIIAFFEAIKPCRMEDMTIEARQVRFAV